MFEPKNKKIESAPCGIFCGNCNWDSCQGCGCHPRAIG